MRPSPGAILIQLRAYACAWMGIVYHYWGNAYGARGAYETAVRWYRRALDLDGSLTQVRLDRAILLLRELGEPQTAINELSHLLALDPADEAARFNRGVAHQQWGDYPHALADFRAYLKIGQHPQRRTYAAKMVQEFGDAKEDENDQRQT